MPAKKTTKADRSAIMRAVGSKDTAPELVVRRLLHSLGFRYRLHRKDLPGSPDIVLPRRRKVVLVHGCFWHGHDCRRGARAPKDNAEYWSSKISRNRTRDAQSEKALRETGWDVLTVWECETKAADREALADRLTSFLGRVPGKR